MVPTSRILRHDTVDVPKSGPGPAIARPGRRTRAWLKEENGLRSARTVAGDLVLVVVLFVAWRGLLFAADYAGRAMSAPVRNEHFMASRFWDGYIRHDSAHLDSIARGGYRVQTEGRWKGLSTNAAFFPLYPYAVRALTFVRVPGYGPVFGSHWAAGLALSNVCLVGSLFFMLRVARTGLDEDGSRRSVVYLLAFPSSFFCSSFYSEGLFLLTTTASFYEFLKGRHVRSGCWGLLAAATRSQGVLLLPAFVLGHFWDRRFRVTRSDAPLLGLALIPCGLLAAMGLYQYKLGNPFAFAAAQAAWGRSFVMPHLTLWTTLRSIDWSLPLGDFGQTSWAIEFVSSVVFLVLPFFLLRGFHKSLAIYAMVLVLVPLSTGMTTSMLRYELVAFPSFFALAKFGERRSADRLLVFGSALLLILMKLAFSNGYMII